MMREVRYLFGAALNKEETVLQRTLTPHIRI